MTLYTSAYNADDDYYYYYTVNFLLTVNMCKIFSYNSGLSQIQVKNCEFFIYDTGMYLMPPRRENVLEFHQNVSYQKIES